MGSLSNDVVQPLASLSGQHGNGILLLILLSNQQHTRSALNGEQGNGFTPPVSRCLLCPFSPISSSWEGCWTELAQPQVHHCSESPQDLAGIGVTWALQPL